MPFFLKIFLSKHLKLSECKANITIEFMARNFKCTIVKSFGFDFVRANGCISLRGGFFFYYLFYLTTIFLDYCRIFILKPLYLN